MKRYEITAYSGECAGAEEYKHGMTYSGEYEIYGETQETFDDLGEALDAWERWYSQSQFLPRKIGRVDVPDVTEYVFEECEYELDDDGEILDAEYRVFLTSDITTEELTGGFEYGRINKPAKEYLKAFSLSDVWHVFSRNPNHSGEFYTAELIDQFGDEIISAATDDGAMIFEDDGWVFLDDGNKFGYFDVLVNLMDDDLREMLHDKLAPCTEQEFVDAYCAAHFERYGEDFTMN